MEAQVVRAMNSVVVGASRWRPLGLAIRKCVCRIAPVHTANVRGVWIKSICPLHQFGNFAEATRWQEREPEVLDWLDTIDSDSVFFDIGSSYGQESLYAALKPAGPRSIFAFDSSFTNSRDLATNIKLNQTTRITNIFAALSDKNGLLTMNEHLPYVQLAGTKRTFVDRTVPAFTLDTLVDELGVLPNHIKIDVDGPEHAVIRGMERTLSSGGVKSMYVEINAKTDIARISDFLGKFGLSLQGQSRANTHNNHVFSVST